MKRFDPAQSSDATDQLRSYGEWLQSQVSPDEALLAATRALASGRPAPRRRWLVAVAVTGLLAIGNVGLAAVSDSSVPGDALYGLDRAYERVGSLLGVSSQAHERLAEAQVLLARGQHQDALEVTGEALAEFNIEANLADLLADVPVAEGTDPELVAATEKLVSMATHVDEFAKDSTERQAAIAALREQAQRVADVARSHGVQPAEDPGQGDGPPEDPGQGNGPPEDFPSNTAPRNPNSPGNQP